MEQELNRLRDKCDGAGGGSQYESPAVRKSSPSVDTNFNQQIVVSPDVYKLVIANSSSLSPPLSTQANSSPSHSLNKKFTPKESFHVGGDVGDGVKSRHDDGIINSVENFQLIQKSIGGGGGEDDQARGVLAQPQLLNAKGASSSTSTTTTTTTTESSRNKEKLEGPPLLKAPMLKESSSSTSTSTRTTTLSTKKIEIPEGVVPFPEQSFLVPEENSNAVETNNRYGNVDEVNNKKSTSDVKQDNLNFLNGHDDDNEANEVPDNDFNIDEMNKKSSKVDGKGVGGGGGGADGGNENNNAEEDTNLYEANKGIFINPGKEGNNAHKNDGNDLKLRHEVMDDQGKEGENDYHNDDVHLDANVSKFLIMNTFL